jgi:hypothetical protein
MIIPHWRTVKYATWPGEAVRIDQQPYKVHAEKTAVIVIHATTLYHNSHHEILNSALTELRDLVQIIFVRQKESDVVCVETRTDDVQVCEKQVSLAKVCHKYDTLMYAGYDGHLCVPRSPFGWIKGGATGKLVVLLEDLIRAGLPGLSHHENLRLTWAAANWAGLQIPVTTSAAILDANK